MQKTRFVVYEQFAGKHKPEDVFAAVFLSNAAALTKRSKSSIIKDADQSQDSLCSRKRAGASALKGMGDGALSGAITGAITGAVSNGVKVVQALKSWNSGTFKSGYKSMNYHYKNKVIGQGFGKGKNVIKYTNDALSFANSNSSYFKYQYSTKYGHSRWFYSNTFAGGFFSKNGKIYTFWYKR